MPAPHRILVDHLGVAQHALRDAVDDQLPRLPVVGRPVDERIAVVHLVEVHGEVGRAGVVARRRDAAHRAPRRQAGQVLRDVGPGLAAVARELHQAVVGAGPDEPLLARRFGDAEDHARVLDADVVGREAAGAAHLRLVVERQVRADHLPALAAVGRAVHVLAADVDRVVIVRRDVQRRVPHEAVPHALGRAVRLVAATPRRCGTAAGSPRSARRCRRPCRSRRPWTRRCSSRSDRASPSRSRRRRPRATSRAGCPGSPPKPPCRRLLLGPR